MTRQPQPEEAPLEDPEDVEDLDDEIDVDQSVPIACQWECPAGAPVVGTTVATSPPTSRPSRQALYGHHDGHVWICPVPVTR
jgi:hypothetical protein